MDHLRFIQTFVEVAHCGSFTAAARKMNISRATAAYHVTMLEEVLSVTLLHRSTQCVRPTAAGATVIETGGMILDDLQRLCDSIRSGIEELRGPIHLGMPHSIARYLMPAFGAFLEDAPEVEIILHLDDGAGNLIGMDLDISIRIVEALKDTDQVARLLADLPRVVVAAPSYIARHGTPARPQDLRRHQCLLHSNYLAAGQWTFMGPKKLETVPVSGHLRANFADCLLEAALAGQGISIHSFFSSAPHVEAGRLVILMPQYRPSRLRVHAIYPKRQHLTVRIRLFLDFLKVWFARNDYSLKYSET